MTKWLVTIQWSVEAETEDDAFMAAADGDGELITEVAVEEDDEDGD